MYSEYCHKNLDSVKSCVNRGWLETHLVEVLFNSISRTVKLDTTRYHRLYYMTPQNVQYKCMYASNEGDGCMGRLVLRQPHVYDYLQLVALRTRCSPHSLQTSSHNSCEAVYDQNALYCDGTERRPNLHIPARMERQEESSCSAATTRRGSLSSSGTCIRLLCGCE